MTEPHFSPPPLREFEFRSKAPVVGGLITAFRRAWHSVSARWAIRSLAQQQDRINAAAAAELANHRARTNQLAAELASYRARIDQLAAEVDRQADASSAQSAALGSQSARMDQLTAEVQRQAEAGAAQSAALAGQSARMDQLAAELQRQAEARASESAALAGRLSQTESNLRTALGEIQARLEAATAHATAQHAAITNETRSSRAQADARLATLQAATQIYLEELGHELADLAQRVGTLAAKEGAQA